jgi:adenylate kinase
MVGDQIFIEKRLPCTVVDLLSACRIMLLPARPEFGLGCSRQRLNQNKREKAQKKNNAFRHDVFPLLHAFLKKSDAVQSPVVIVDNEKQAFACPAGK